MRLVKPRRAFARVLSSLLLGFIVYGTTVEAEHTHGSLTAASNIVDASNFSDPASETKANTTLLGSGQRSARPFVLSRRGFRTAALGSEIFPAPEAADLRERVGP